MSRLQCRGSIALAAVLVALLLSATADAQVVVVVPSPRQPKHPGHPLVTGVAYDVKNQEMAERKLEKLQAKSRRDAERCDSDAADHDARRINELRYRIVVDEWLIRWNSLHNPGSYPLRIDTMSCAAIAQAASPPSGPDPSLLVPSQGPIAPATISITIVNAEPAGTDVAFAIGGVAHEAAGGSRQNLVVAPGSYITFDAGGSLGQRRYRITAGLYEFRSTAEGWALYKLPDMP
jgi:hypothetical protein